MTIASLPFSNDYRAGVYELYAYFCLMASISLKPDLKKVAQLMEMTPNQVDVHYPADGIDQSLFEWMRDIHLPMKYNKYHSKNVLMPPDKIHTVCCVLQIMKRLNGYRNPELNITVPSFAEKVKNVKLAIGNKQGTKKDFEYILKYIKPPEITTVEVTKWYFYTSAFNLRNFTQEILNDTINKKGTITVTSSAAQNQVLMWMEEWKIVFPPEDETRFAWEKNWFNKKHAYLKTHPKPPLS